MIRQTEKTTSYTNKVSHDSDTNGIYDDLEVKGHVADEIGLKVVAYMEGFKLIPMIN